METQSGNLVGISVARGGSLADHLFRSQLDDSNVTRQAPNPVWVQAQEAVLDDIHTFPSGLTSNQIRETTNQ